MESSTVLAFRIFVMLSCLIIVPMAAIFGSAFPDVVKSVLVDRIVALGSGTTDEPEAAAPDPNGFREVTPGTDRAGNWEAPRWGTPQSEAVAWQAPAAAPSNAEIVPLGGPPPRGGFNQSASFSAPAGSDPGVVQRLSAPTVEVAPSGGDGVGGRGAPAGTITGVVPGNVSAAASHLACPIEQPDGFTEMERKLREYGATYYLLETWGKEGELYRFHCRMAVSNNAQYTRHFEATDHNALQAMADVLKQVEAWRAGQLQ